MTACSVVVYAPTFTGGAWIASRDVTGDNKADIITGSGPGGGPHVKAFRSTDAFLLLRHFAHDPGFLGGIFVG